MHSNKTIRRTVPIAVATVLAAVALTGCTAVENLVASASDAWQVTYELSVDSGQSSTIADVSYLSRETRLDDQESEQIDSIAIDPAEAWSVDTVAIVGESVRITATPTGKERATCRIMLDETHEIVSETGSPGESVTCEAIAPPFEK